MSRGKTGLIVLTGLAVMFFLFVAILFGSSAKRQAVIARKTALDSKLDQIAGTDIAIYWIGEPYQELEHLLPVIKTVPPAEASSSTLPVKGYSFHITVYNALGQVTSENTPIEYPDNMVIIITGNPQMDDEGKEALIDSIARNGVPVIAVGDEAAEFLGDILLYHRLYRGAGSSLYYCLGAGYKENPVPEEMVLAGGMDLAEAFPDLISLAVSDYKPQK